MTAPQKAWWLFLLAVMLLLAVAVPTEAQQNGGFNFTNLTRLNNASQPQGTPSDIALYPNGTEALLSYNTVSPYMLNYLRNTSDPTGWTKLSNPATTPPTSANSVAYSADGGWLVLGYTASGNNMTLYTRSSHASGWTASTAPTNLPQGDVYGTAFTPTTSQLIVGANNAPYLFIYNRNTSDASGWTLGTNPSTAPTNSVYEVRIRDDGQYMAALQSTAPFINIYVRNTSHASGWTRLSTPTTTPAGASGTGANAMAFGNSSGTYVNNTFVNGSFLAIAHATSPFITIYQYNASDPALWTKQPDPSSLPPSTGQGVAFSSDGKLLFVGHVTGGTDGSNTSAYVRNSSAGAGWSRLMNFTDMPRYQGRVLLATPQRELLVFTSTAAGAQNMSRYQINLPFTLDNTTDNLTGTRINNYNASFVTGSKYYVSTTGEVQGQIETDILRNTLQSITVCSPGYRCNTTATWNTAVDLNITLGRDYAWNYTNPELENTITYHYLNTTTNMNASGNVSNITATFTWNGTSYNFNSTNVLANFSQGVYTGINVNASQNYLFRWNWTLQYTDGTTESFDTGGINQTINQLDLNNCSSGTPSINLRLLSEQTNSSIVGNVDAAFWIYTNASLKTNRNFNLSGYSNYTLCLNPGTATVQVDSIMRYYASGYTNRGYYLNNATINGTLQNIDLFLLDDVNASNVLTYVFNKDTLYPLSYAYIKALRYYPSTNTYSTVEIERADEFGNTVLHLILYDVLYRFVIEDSDGNTLKITNAAVLTGNTLNIPVSTQNNWFETFETNNDIAYSLTFNGTTHVFTYTFDDTSNTVSRGCLKVLRRTTLTDTNLCSSCVASSAGSLSCNITSSWNQTGVFMATGDVMPSGTNVTYNLGTLTAENNQARAIFGDGGTFLGVILLVTITMAGLWNPAVAVVLALVGVIAGVMTGLFSMAYMSVITLVIVGFIIIFKMRG